MFSTVNSFAANECGAVAVDWVVLSSGVVGLGIAMASVASGGVENLSNDVAQSLANARIFVGETIEMVSHDFSGGDAGGWIGGTVMDMGGQLGEVLVVGPGARAGFTLDVPSGTTEATMTFDLVAGDSLDNSARWGTDTAVVMVNGVPVAIATSNAGSNLTFDIPQNDGTTVEATVIVEPGRLGGAQRWADSVAQVTVTVDRPTGPIDLQMQSNANQGIRDEYWGVDNFDASVVR